MLNLLLRIGDTSEFVQQYYEQIWANNIQGIPVPRTDILLSGPFYIFLWAAILIGFFYFYTRSFQNVHREKGELYGAASFAGSILERIGRIASFSILVWLLVIIVAVYYTVMLTIRGWTF